jgi:YidC/Oxa1 family membrane protein insertase
MADLSGKPPENKELSVETRLLIAFILMGVVLFTTPYFFKTQAPPPPANKTEQPATPQTDQPAQAAPVVAAAAPAAGAVSAAGEETITVDTELYHIVFSNRGAVVRSWILKKYKDSHQKPLEIVNTAAGPVVGYPFSLEFKSQKPAVDLNQALYAVKRSDNGLEVSFEFSDGKLLSKKSFQFASNSYLPQISTEVSDGGAPVPHLIAWRGGFGDMSVPSPAAAQHTVYYDTASNKLKKTSASDAKNGPVGASGIFQFAGIEDLYFAAVFLPPPSPIEIVTYNDKAPRPAKAEPEPLAGVAVGVGGVNRFALFAGPKDVDILKQVNPKLEQLVDFGWLSFIAKPLFLVMHWLNDNYIHNYGWTIILMTVFINFALFPLKITSMKSMKKMQALQPQIAAINDKYKNIGMRDPKKQEQNQEVMALYQKHGVNPLGGCMPIALQMPFLFAFYNVFSVAIEMRGANWLWVTDLSQPESIPIRLLPIAMIATQFIMQRMTPSTGGDPAQQKVMMFMPLIFGFMFYSASSGLVLYWLTGNIVNILQQWFFNRTAVAPDVGLVKKKVSRK